MYECFHCGGRTVIWDSDYDLEDVGFEYKGVAHCLHCTRCGAVIEYIIREGGETDDDT